MQKPFKTDLNEEHFIGALVWKESKHRSKQRGMRLGERPLIEESKIISSKNPTKSKEPNKKIQADLLKQQ